MGYILGILVKSTEWTNLINTWKNDDSSYLLHIHILHHSLVLKKMRLTVEAQGELALNNEFPACILSLSRRRKLSYRYKHYATLSWHHVIYIYYKLS